MENKEPLPDRNFFMQACFVPVAHDSKIDPQKFQLPEDSFKRPAIFDDFIMRNPYRGSFERKSQSKHESVINKVDVDPIGEMLFESRVDLDEADAKSMDESSFFMKSIPMGQLQSLSQSIFQLGLVWKEYEKPITIGQSLDSLFNQVPELMKIIPPGTLFRDPAFKATLDSIRGTTISEEAEKFKTVNWVRVADIFKGTSYSLFGAAISPLDIEQGELGNCYFLSVASSLAQYPARVKRLFLQDSQSAKRGLYSVMLCNSGMWIETIVDDKFPCATIGGVPRLAFNRSSNGNVWGMILEKGWAKLIGGYFSISSGTCAEGMHLLTGAPTESVRIDQHPPDHILRVIYNSTMQGYLMTASSNSNFDEIEVGILKSHAYSILGFICLREYETGIYQVEHLENPIKADTQNMVFLLRLRNPWANKDKWKGKWSFHDPVWMTNFDVLANIGLDKVRDRTGIVLIELKEFIKYFIEFDVCKYEDDFKYTYWNIGQAKGIPEFYDMEISKSGRYTFGLSQINPRILPAIDQQRYELSRASIVIFKLNDKGKPQYIKGSCSSRLHTFVECQDLVAGRYIAMVTLQWQSDIEQACLNCYGIGPVQMQRRNVPYKDKWELLRSVYKSRAKMFDGSPAEKLTNIKGLDPKISYKHQILDDGYGYFYFANRGTSSKVTFFVELLAMENLHFTEPLAKVTNQFEVVLPPRTADIRVYAQVTAPNRIKFKIKVLEQAIQAQPTLVIPSHNHQIYSPLLKMKSAPGQPNTINRTNWSPQNVDNLPSPTSPHDLNKDFRK